MQNKFVCRDVNNNRYLTYLYNSGYVWTKTLTNTYSFDTITEADNFASGATEVLQKHDAKIEIVKISDIV